jgi:DNA-binding XRE family transcriptional regulator
MIGAVKVEVRATGLKAMREKRGLKQRKLAHDLGISQNYIPAIEAGARNAGPKLQQQLITYFGCPIRGVVPSGPGRWRDKEGAGTGATPRVRRWDDVRKAIPVFCGHQTRLF